MCRNKRWSTTLHQNFFSEKTKLRKQEQNSLNLRPENSKQICPTERQKRNSEKLVYIQLATCESPKENKKGKDYRSLTLRYK